MKNIIYEVLVGLALLSGLYAMLPLVKANQAFIVTSETRDTNLSIAVNSRDDEGEEDFEENRYTAVDVVGTILHYVQNDGTLMPGIVIKVNPSIVLSSSSTPDYIMNVVNQLSASEASINRVYDESKEVNPSGQITFIYE